jgi:hypothetical protein
MKDDFQIIREEIPYGSIMTVEAYKGSLIYYIDRDRHLQRKIMEKKQWLPFSLTPMDRRLDETVTSSNYKTYVEDQKKYRKEQKKSEQILIDHIQLNLPNADEMRIIYQSSADIGRGFFMYAIQYERENNNEGMY